MMMQTAKLATICGCIGTMQFALGATCLAQVTLYQDNFDGGATPIHGVGPDVNNYDGVSTWNAADLFQADGTALADSEGAMVLPFAPTNGQVYTLSTTFLNEGPSWLATGFTQNGTADDGTVEGLSARHSNQLAGRLWALSRDNDDQNNQEFFEGGGTANNQPDASGDLVTDLSVPIEIEIVLDTRNYDAWEYDVLYDGTSPLGGPVVAVDTADLRDNINFVAVSRDVAGADGVPDETDLDAELVSIELTQLCKPGDVNCDGAVGLADFEFIRDNAFDNVNQRIGGDLNGDGFVDFVDFRQWKNHDESGMAAFVSFGNVPEPATWLLALVAAAGMSATRRRC